MRRNPRRQQRRRRSERAARAQVQTPAPRGNQRSPATGSSSCPLPPWTRSDSPSERTGGVPRTSKRHRATGRALMTPLVMTRAGSRRAALGEPPATDTEPSRSHSQDIKGRKSSPRSVRPSVGNRQATSAWLLPPRCCPRSAGWRDARALGALARSSGGQWRRAYARSGPRERPTTGLCARSRRHPSGWRYPGPRRRPLT
jgi:hypothetical protein